MDLVAQIASEFQLAIRGRVPEAVRMLEVVRRKAIHVRDFLI